MKNARNLILIVEDDEKLRQTLEDFLTANHFAVLTAVDGEQALTLYYANNHLIDLILLDGMLPGMDGFDVLKTALIRHIYVKLFKYTVDKSALFTGKNPVIKNEPEKLVFYDREREVFMKNARNLILIVEDDEKLRQTLEDFLTANHFAVLTAVDGEQALTLYYANNHLIDLILLDGMLPGMDGFDVLKTIRQCSDVPIIMLTARESEEDQLTGLTNGADNYITKPFRLRVLKAHMDVLLKRNNRAAADEIEAGKLRLEQASQRAFADEVPLNLTPKEFALLLYFVQNRDLVLTREVILDAVWGFDYQGDIRTVDTLVKQLRKKLPDSCPYIQSIYGVGYRFEVTDHE